MEETVSPGGPVNSAHIEAYPYQGDGEYTTNPAYGKSISYTLLISVSGK